MCYQTAPKMWERAAARRVITLPTRRVITLPTKCVINLPPRRVITLPSRHVITLPTGHVITRPSRHMITLPTRHEITLPPNLPSTFHYKDGKTKGKIKYKLSAEFEPMTPGPLLVDKHHIAIFENKEILQPLAASSTAKQRSGCC